MTTEQLRRHAEHLWPAAQRDLSKPGRTRAVRAYYRTLTLLQARYRKQAAQREVQS